MVERIGMNVGDVAGHAHTMRTLTSQLDYMATQVDEAAEFSIRKLAPTPVDFIFPLRWLVSTVNTVVMSPASTQLAKNAASDIRAAAADAEVLLARLGVHIAEQELASSATEGYLDGLMSRSRADDLHRRAMADPSVLADLSPLQVSAWWDRLSKAQQDDFISAHHWVAGNTNGIPFARRIEANQLSAAEMLASGTMNPSSNEFAYLSEVVDGERTLISFDPANDRIIEMIGEITEKTRDIVSYVPGTTADLQGFYDLGTQQIGQHLVDTAQPPGSTVAFIFKDAEFPTFGPDGVYHSSWAASVGDPYHRFQQALGIENTSGIPVTSIEHSFGSSVGGYAEIQGTTFDTRIVLAGAGMTEEWKPVPGTDYFSLTGSDDIIRVAREKHSDDLNTGYKHPPTSASGFVELDPQLPAWRPGAYVATGVTMNPMGPGMDPVTQHTTIATAGDDNAVALRHMREIVAR